MIEDEGYCNFNAKYGIKKFLQIQEFANPMIYTDRFIDSELIEKIGKFIHENDSLLLDNQTDITMCLRGRGIKFNNPIY